MAKKNNLPSITIHCDKNITDITKSADGTGFIKHYKDGNSIDIDATYAARDITALYIEYLVSGGRCKTLPILNDPRPLFEEYISKSIPLANEDDTAYYLSQLTVAMRYFKGKRSKNYEPAYGLGLFISIFADAYYGKKKYLNSEVCRKFITLIASGLYTLQLKNKILTLHIYQGIYHGWSKAKTNHDWLFYENKDKLSGGFIDLLTCKDLTKDPLKHGWMYPNNLTSYSIDNIILTQVVVRWLLWIHQESGNKALDDEEFSLYSALNNTLMKFLLDDCPQYMIRTKELIDNPGDESYTDSWHYMRQFMKHYMPGGATARCPALECAVLSFGAFSKEDVSYVMATCQTLTDTPYNKLDTGCPVLYAHKLYKERQKRLNIQRVVDFTFVAAIYLAYFLSKKFFSWMQAEGFLVPLGALLLLGLPALANHNSNEKDSGLAINMSTGHMEYIWWL